VADQALERCGDRGNVGEEPGDGVTCETPCQVRGSLGAALGSIRVCTPNRAQRGAF
jgi:hypothetical protein